MAQAQIEVSRQLTEELIDQEPIEQSAMQFETTEVLFPAMADTTQPFTAEYRYVNKGQESLIIRKVTSSCGCITADYSTRPVSMDSTGVVKVAFNPKGYAGSIFREINVYTSLSLQRPTARLRLSGEVIPTDPWRNYPYKIGLLRTRQKSVTFKLTNSSEKQGESIVCVNSGESDMRLSAVDLPPYLKFRTNPSVIKSGQEADLQFLLDVALLPSTLREDTIIPVVLNGVESSEKERTVNVFLQFE